LEDDGEDCLVSIDTTDVPIEEPKPFSRKWYSHKFEGAGLRYEIAVSIKKGYIVWVNGPYPCGSYPDISIFRHALKHYLEKDERVEADDGYRGDEPAYCKTPGGFSSRSEGTEARQIRRRVRSRHETVNKRIKDFGILSQVYRHNLIGHCHVFRAVIVLTQLAIENGEPLFEI